MSLVAAALVLIASLLVRPSGRWVVHERLATPMLMTVRPSIVITPLSVMACAVVVAVGLPPGRLIAVLTGAGVVWFAVRQMLAERARRRARVQRDAVAEALSLLAAELRAGILPQRALSGLAPDFAFLAPASRAAELGGDVSSALQRQSAIPGCELLSAVASAWMVAERSGAPLARALDRLETSTRDDREIERDVQSGVAPARATGRLMAILPVVGLAMGSGMGGDPVALLTSTVPGALCLAAGSACACAGVAWVNRIATTAERTG